MHGGNLPLSPPWYPSPWDLDSGSGELMRLQGLDGRVSGWGWPQGSQLISPLGCCWPHCPSSWEAPGWGGGLLALSKTVCRGQKPAELLFPPGDMLAACLSARASVSAGAPDLAPSRCHFFSEWQKLPCPPYFQPRHLSVLRHSQGLTLMEHEASGTWRLSPCLCPLRQGAQSWSAGSNPREGAAKTGEEEWNICWPHGKRTGTEGSEILFYSPAMVLPMACRLMGRPSSPAALSAGVSRPPWPGGLGQHCFRHSSGAGEASSREW